MKRRSTPLLYGVAVAIGIVIGAGIDFRSASNLTQSKAFGSRNADDLYAELGRDSSSLLDGSRVLAKIATLTTPSVVHIQSERNNSGRGTIEETGSGVLVNSDKAAGVFVVTNRHVIANADVDSISIHLHDGRVIHPEQIWSDTATDVAVLKVTADNLRPARWGNSDDVEIGHMVLAMGSPFGLSQSVTLGIISAKGRRSLSLGSGRRVLNQDFLQTDAAINPGNSGGPLIDMRGRAVGINTAIASNSGGNEGIGFSIPSNLVRRVVEQLLEHGKVERAYLGVKLNPNFDSETAARLQLDRVRGAHVVEVYAKTPASRANLKFDDVILSFDGIDVQDENHLINLVSLTPVGKQVRLVILRGNVRVTIQVTLGDRESLEQRSEAAPQPNGAGPKLNAVPMGLTVHSLESGITAQLGLESSARGVVVLNFDPNSRWGQSLELYDVIEEVGRVRITSADEFHAALDQHDTAMPLLLKVRRDTNGVAASRVVVCEPESTPVAP